VTRAAVLLAALGVLAGMGCARRPAPRPSVLLVTIDTLRADHVGAYGATSGATPTLDALARQGVLWQEASTAVPLTLPSHATILTGLLPPHHGVRDNDAAGLPPQHVTLAARAKAQGYATGAFVGAYVLDRRFGLSNGFDVYDDRIERAGDGRSLNALERRCDAVAQAALGWLRSVRGPFLAWVHFYDPHFPYEPPAPYAERFAGRAYDGEIAAADACLGRVLDGARQAAPAGLLVAVLSDHGEGLFDHGEPTHGFFVYETTLRVPLVIAGPGIPSGERRSGLARTVDVMPTLLARLGLGAGVVDGADLFGGLEARESFAESRYPLNFGWAPLYALRLGREKYVDAPHPELYDLRSDPLEQHNQADAKPAEVERFRRALRALGANDSETTPRSSRPEVAEKLRALGYVAGGPSAAAGPRKDPKDALPLWRDFEEANALEARGERERAIAAYRRLTAQEPNNATFLRTLASALRKSGRLAEALGALQGLEQLAPDDARAWHDQALVLAAAGRLDDALRSDERASLLDPSAAEPLNHRALLLATRGRFDEALAAADAATRLDPNGAQAWNNRGNILRGLSRPHEAEESYRRAAALEPRALDAWNGLGVLAVERGDLDGAAELFRRVLALDPGYQEARLNLAALLAQRGRNDEARRLAEQVASATAPRSPLGQKSRRLLNDLASIH
jgi:arylsulfatase A-like enzyme/tetratricopeptide (TPR) repeat protein